MPDADSAALARTGPAVTEREPSAVQRFWRWLVRRPRLMVFGSVILSMVLIAVFAPLIAPEDPIRTHPVRSLQKPSVAHPFGTDQLGRDVLSRVIYGARISLAVAVIAVSIALAGGVSLGVVAGWYGGFTDGVLSRFIDALLAFPGILLAIAITNALGPSLSNAMIAVGVLGIPTYFRLARGQVLQAREQEYVTAAKVLGADEMRLLMRHVVPNIINPLIVAASIASSGAILALAALSFLGIGSQPPAPDWGSMIDQGRSYIGRADWLWLAPAIGIFFTVFSFYMLGDALRDALDPRLRNR